MDEKKSEGKKYDWTLPVILGFVLGTFGPILGNIISDEPDFSISASPPVIENIGHLGNVNTNITIKNIHHLLHSFEQPISLIAHTPAGTKIETSFNPSQISFNRRSELVSLMQISIKDPLNIGYYPIEVVATAEDGTKKSFVLDLEIEPFPTRVNRTLISGAGRK